MSDWTSGYVADIGYTYGYYPELNPERIRLAFLDAGLVMPEIANACEMGFGQGVSVNVHAAASGASWYGSDFNPSHAGFAAQLAAQSGNGAVLSDEAFADFCHRSDLPEFDFIGLHGIWSWISDANRAVIVDFIRRKLKVGGVVYISYNTQPGWAAMAPLRHLMTQHAQIMGSPAQGIVPRIDAALQFAEQLMDLKPAFATANPQAAERLKKLKDHGRNYLAHEYFNQDWEPMPFARMAQWLMPAKVSYACSAHYLDHIPAVNLGSEQQAFLKAIPDPMFRETVLDYMVNSQFRRDYWVKGPRKLDTVSLAGQWSRQRVVLAIPRSEVSMQVTGVVGVAELTRKIYEPILDLLADHIPREAGELANLLASQTVTAMQLRQAIILLAGRGDIFTCQPEPIRAAAQAKCDALNQIILDQSRGAGEVGFMASPLTGGGVAVPRFHQLFLLARTNGASTAPDAAAYAWKLLSEQGHRLVKEGKTLETPQDNLAHMTAEAHNFFDKRLPILKALGVAS